MAKGMTAYSDKLQADEQITMEESIAWRLFDFYGMENESANAASKDILLMILKQFRPDLIQATQDK